MANDTGIEDFDAMIAEPMADQSSRQMEQKVINIGGMCKMPRFNGKGSVTRFIKNFEKRMLIEGWNEETARSILYLCLEGEADDYLDTLETEVEDMTYSDLQQILLRRFRPRMSKADLLQMLMGTKQNNGESVDNFSKRIDKIAADYSDLLTDNKEDYLKAAFISGLDDHLKGFILVAEDATYEAAVLKAIQLEKTMPQRKKQVFTTNDTTTENLRRQNNGPSNQRNNNRSNHQQWMPKNNNNFRPPRYGPPMIWARNNMRQPPANTYQYGTYRPRTQVYAPQMPPHTQYSKEPFQGYCFNCGRYGHRRHECRSRALPRQ